MQRMALAEYLKGSESSRLRPIRWAGEYSFATTAATTRKP